MTDFQPPVYSNLGKSYKDLYKKQFDFDNAVKVINKTDFGLTLTTAGTLKKDSIVGNQKVNYKDKRFGEADVEIDTASGKVWAKSTFDNLVKFTKIIFSGGLDPTSQDALVKDGWSGKGEVEYRKGALSATGGVLVGDDNGHNGAAAEAAGVIGFDGISVGGQAKYKVGDQGFEGNVASQYEHKDFTATMISEFQGDVLRFSWFHKVSAAYQLGVEILSDEFDHVSKPDDARRKVLTLASQYQLDADTIVKARGNNFGELGAAIQHRLANPLVQIGAAAQFKAKGTSKIAADKFGLALTFGDF